VKTTEPVTTVRIHLTNTGHILIAKVQVKGGMACVDGDYVIGGVTGTSAAIEMDWSGVIGSTTGKLLLTGNSMDIIKMDGKKYNLSVVDAETWSFMLEPKTLD